MTARNDLLQLFADWGTTSGKGARERADRILAKHQTEVRVATLREAAAALEVNARQGDQDGLTRIYKRAAVDFLRGMAAQVAPADWPPADVRGGFWPGMTGGLCSVCHIAEVRGGQPDPACADCRTVAAPANRPTTGDPMTDQTDPYAFIPPSAEGLPTGALDSATRGANALDAYALTRYGRNLLAHALTGLARDGWLRPDPGQGWEPTPEPTDQPADRPADDTQQQETTCPSGRHVLYRPDGYTKPGIVICGCPATR